MIVQHSPYKCIEKQIWPCCEKSQVNPGFNLVELKSSMLYTCTKIQPQCFLDSGEEDLSVLPYMGMTAILVDLDRVWPF